MNLIDRDAVLKTIPSEEMVARMAVMSAPPVDVVPIEWIEFYISEIEDNVPDVARAFKELIEIWNEEHLIEQWKKKQEKQNEQRMRYMPRVQRLPL